jgi:hypothetical protein
MRIQGAVVIACVAIVGLSTEAAAQDSPRVGITMGYPASFGVLWHLSDRVALRPELSFTFTDSSSESIVDDQTNFWSLGTGISVLFYSSLSDNLRTYVAPRFSYGRTSGDSNSTDSTSDSYMYGGMFGGQYSLSRRFAAFGEVGVNYSHQSSTVTSMIGPATDTITSHGNVFGIRTAVGVILYF